MSNTSVWFFIGHLCRNATDQLGKPMEYPVTVRIPKWLYDEDVATGRMDVLKDRMSFERHDSPEVEVIIDGETILSENLPKDAVRV